MKLPLEVRTAGIYNTALVDTDDLPVAYGMKPQDAHQLRKIVIEHATMVSLLRAHQLRWTGLMANDEADALASETEALLATFPEEV